MITSKRIVDKTEVAVENGLVTAVHPLAAQAGLAILQQGGNAADAAVPAAFAAGVVEPFMSGLGGAAYIVAHEAANDRTVTLDGSVVVPGAARDDMFELMDSSIRGVGVYGRAGQAGPPRRDAGSHIRRGRSAYGVGSARCS